VSIEIIGSGQRRQNPGCRMLGIAYKWIVSEDGFFLKVHNNKLVLSVCALVLQNLFWIGSYVLPVQCCFDITN
jgi:hypothetical protein